ncbi:MAG: ATP-grasp domain-containing protein [Algibacter sp.]
MNILFTCAGRRNYLIDYFKEALNGKGKIIAVDTDCYAPALAVADINYKVSSILNPDYINELKDIIIKENIGALISLNDLELSLLSENKLEFENLGARVLLSDTGIIDMCFDKWKTYNFLKKAKINTPITYLSIDDVLIAIKNSEVSYPLIVKPRWGSASMGIMVVESENELKLAYQLLEIQIKKNDHFQKEHYYNEKCILIQEKIIGQEYGIDILNDFEGNYYASFVRKKVNMRSGETDKAISVIEKKYSAIGEIIGKATKHIGNMDCDFFVSEDGKVYFLEMNPRFGGGYPFSHNAGINIPAIYVSWLKGDGDINKYNNYKANLGFAKYDQMIRINDECLLNKLK